MAGRITGRKLARLAASYRRHCFAVLFATLLLTLALAAVLDALIPRINGLQLLLAINLLAAIAIVATEGEGPMLLGLAATFLVIHALLSGFGVSDILSLSEGVWIVAVALATSAAARHAFRRGAVDAERILAALDAYVLTGFLFGAAYLMVDRLWPGSFGGNSPPVLDRGHAMYFSFVTLATLGYGDLTPASPPARGLAILEGIGGQMYLTVLVARLVGQFSQGPRN